MARQTCRRSFESLVPGYQPFKLPRDISFLAFLFLLTSRSESSRFPAPLYQLPFYLHFFTSSIILGRRNRADLYYVSPHVKYDRTESTIVLEDYVHIGSLDGRKCPWTAHRGNVQRLRIELGKSLRRLTGQQAWRR